MVFGSIFRKLDYIDLTTADDVKISFKNNFVSKIGFFLLGLPHIGLRLRARKITRNVKSTERMLDAGCGTGVYSFTLAKKIKEINAIDIEKEKIDYVKKVNLWKNIKFEIGDLCNLKFPDETFNLIICSDVLEHIKNDKKAFSEIARVLSHQGVLLITVPYNSKSNQESYKMYHHERAGYDEKTIDELCKKNNLILVKSEKYACHITEKISNFLFKYNNNKIILGILFYPLYLMAILFDKISTKEFNGIFFRIEKM
jgi:ubiquinone/menaquinone biosynthesis C-methylase UbiE